MKPGRSSAPKAIPEYWLYWTYRNRELLKNPLRALDGRQVRIIDPGLRNEDNGPDFRNAVLEIEGLRWRGDVEIHGRASDWFRHGHQQDERYGNVILHIIWDKNDAIPPGLSARFCHVALREQLRIPEEQWREAMARLDEENPDITPVSRHDLPVTSACLEELAERRFQRKIERYRTWCGLYSPEDALYIALAEALGYSKNKFPLRQLLWECPPSHIYSIIPARQRSPLSIWTYLVLRGNLLPAPALAGKTRPEFPDSPAFETLHRHFRERGFYPLLALSDWNFSRLRPANSPYLRLSALAGWLYRYQSPGLFEKLLSSAMERLPLPETLGRWQNCLQLPADPALAALLRERLGYIALPRNIIGVSRLRQFFLNALIPLLCIWAERSGNPGFRAYLGGLFESFPAAEDRHLLSRQLAGIANGDLARKVRQSGYYQQGMIEYMTR